MTTTPSSTHSQPSQRSSLRRKFIRTMLSVSSIIGVATLVVVLLQSTRASERQLRAIETSIEQGIISKGKVLTENHALALRSMVLDNAFLDMQTLVARVVSTDPDLVYGLFVNSEGEALAFRRQDDGPGTPSKDAGVKLGLQRNELLVGAESVRRNVRLGQEVIEVAVPVFGEEHELLGTIRYGLSTRNMHEAIVAAAAESKAQQLRSIEWIGTTVGVATMLGILLSRMQAIRITRPVQALAGAARELSAGNMNVRVQIDSDDELQMLGLSFNRMVFDLSSSREALENMNRSLELRVASRTLELAERNRAMRLVLDNVDQGFVTLLPDGKMASEHSAIFETWFGQYSSSDTFWQYLSAIAPAFALCFELGWDQVCADFLPYQVAVDQLPSRLTAKGSTFSFRYLPLKRDGRPDGVLIVVADITEKLQREREEAELAGLMQGFRQLMLDRSGFLAFLDEASEMVEQVCERAGSTAPATLRSTLHTLKGNAGTMGLRVVAALCHQLEDELASGDGMTAASLQQLSRRWRVVTEHMSLLVGPRDRHKIEVADTDYSALISLLARDAQSQALDQVLSWQSEPSSLVLARLGQQAQALAKRLGKGELKVEIQASSVRLDPELFGPLFSDLGHVVRNAVDHGIEPSAERVAKGKPPCGQMVFSARAQDKSLIIQIADDGAGIDWDTIRERGVALGLPGGSAAELFAILCAPGVTTATDVTETSGRGVGMAAVKLRVEALRGKLEVQSTRGVGTTWSVILPWAVEPVAERLRRFSQKSVLAGRPVSLAPTRH